MIPLKSIQNIVSNYEILEKDLSSGKVDKKQFAVKSKEYSIITDVIKEARAYLNFEKNKESNICITFDDGLKSQYEVANVDPLFTFLWNQYVFLNYRD